MDEMTEEQYDEITLRVDAGGSVTFEEFKGAVRFMRWHGVGLYPSMTADDWLTTVEDLMDAIKG